MIMQTVAAAVGTIAFSLLFGVPRRYYPYCGFIGGAGWLVYAWALNTGDASVAALAAAIVVILFSRFFAVRERCPVTIFLISGIFPLVPGAGLYWTAYYIVMGELGKAAYTGFAALKVAVSIVLGIVFVFELPQSLFRALAGRRKVEKR